MTLSVTWDSCCLTRHINCNYNLTAVDPNDFIILSLRQHVMTSCTWVSVTSSDDFKLCVGRTRLTWTTNIMTPAVYACPSHCIPLHSKAAGVSNTSVKTLPQRSCRSDTWSTPGTCLGINDPARWTVGACRRSDADIWLTHDNRHGQKVLNSLTGRCNCNLTTAQVWYTM